MTKILHCSDLHLDSKMESNLSRKQANQRRAEIRETFVRLIEYAQENDYSVVIIAGDLFDESRCSLTTSESVLEAIREASEIDFLYLKGNHDERNALADIDLPSNLKLFGSEWVSYDYADVRISGIEIDGTNFKTMYQSYSAKPGAKNVVVLHGQVSSQPGCIDVSISDLRGRGIDYLALGHLHSYQIGELGGGGKYCYSGCLEGRGFDECGKKGFVSIEIQGDKLVSEFVPFAKRTLHELKVDVTGLYSYPEFEKALKVAVKGIPADDLVKFVLVGQCDPAANKDVQSLEKAIESSFFFIKISDMTTLKIDPSDYVNDVSLRGEFVRLVLARDDISAETRDKILLSGLRAIAGEDIRL
ncbi:metallophosphoesterase family protein [Adlercreutzia aquisgranensis]|uniref:metallophosphoesterase family protein n=1 Tax=Adlercreutzia aquisgranensis TaxID=2941323 RepID=UPI00203F3537|nr:DNA repair exonuclease [Adlercreutzia aquisgranensis]